MTSGEQLSICETNATREPLPSRADRSPSSPQGGSAPPAPRPSAVRRVALTLDEAAEAIGVSRDHFERHVKRDLRIVYVGRRILVPVAELERWVERQAVALPVSRRR